MTALPDRSGYGANEVSVERLEFVAALLTSARDLEELVTHIHTIVEQTVAADQTGFYLYDEESARLRLLIAKGLDEDERRSAETTAMERHPGEVFVTRRPLFIEDTSEALKREIMVIDDLIEESEKDIMNAKKKLAREVRESGDRVKIM